MIKEQTGPGSSENGRSGYPPNDPVVMTPGCLYLPQSWYEASLPVAGARPAEVRSGSAIRSCA